MISTKQLFGIFAISLLGCTNVRQTNLDQETEKAVQVTDTIVGSRAITDELAGGNYRKRAMGYFVIVGKDTSDYTCIFTESKEGGKVGMDLNISYWKLTHTYRERFDELKHILRKVGEDFNLDSLSGVYYGRLMQSGDLAIDVTRQYEEQFGSIRKIKNFPVKDYSRVSQFLKTSKLATDLETLLKEQSLVVEKVHIEKVIIFPGEDLYSTRKGVFRLSNIEIDTTQVPEKILDCMLGVELKKK